MAPLPWCLRVKKAKESGLKPWAYSSWAVASGIPAIMGIGPVQSTRKGRLPLAGMKLEGRSIAWNVNEASPRNDSRSEKEKIGLNRDKRPTWNGGAIALGHPLGAYGASLASPLLNIEIRLKLALMVLARRASGRRQGIAIIVEKLPWNFNYRDTLSNRAANLHHWAGVQ